MKNRLVSYLFRFFVGGVVLASGIGLWDFLDPGDYVLSDEIKVEIVGDQVVLKNWREFQINDEIEGIQNVGDIVELENGNLFIFFVSRDNNHAGTDNDNYHVAAKILDPLGRVVVSEFQVNDEIEGLQSPVYAELLSNGNVIVLWPSLDLNTPFEDNDTRYLAAKILSPEGATIVPEFQVNDEIEGAVYGPSALTLEDGNVFVTWESRDLNNPFTDNDTSYRAAKILDVDGATVVSEFQVNDEVDGSQGAAYMFLPSVDLGNEKIMVFWSSQDNNTSFTDTEVPYIAAKIIDYNGNTVLSEFQVNDEIEGGQFAPSAIRLNNGNIFVAWNSLDLNHAGTDNDNYHIAAKILDEDGETVVSEFQVNDEIEGGQRAFSVDKLSNGNVFIAFASQDTNHAGTDNSGYHIAAKILDEDGDTVVSEFQVNEQTSGDQGTNLGGIYVEAFDDRVMINWINLGVNTYGTDNDSASVMAKVLDNDGEEIYYADGPYIEPVNGVLFESNLRGLVVEYGEENEGVMRFQVSVNDGVNWNYYDGSEWTDVTSSQIEYTNTLEEVNENLYALANSGTFKWRGFLVSDLGFEQVEVDSVALEDNSAPEFTSFGGVDSYDLNYYFGSGDVTTLEAIDEDDDTLSFEVSGGLDAAKFTVEESTGVLSFVDDIVVDETYVVEISVNDGYGGVDVIELNINVLERLRNPGSGSSSTDTKSPFDGLEDDEPEDVIDSKTESDGATEGSLSVVDKFLDLGCVNDVYMGVSFDLSSFVTRLDVLKFILAVKCVDLDAYGEIESTFKDVQNLSGDDRKVLAVSEMLGLVRGYGDGTVKPNRFVNYAELSAMLVRSKVTDSLEELVPWYSVYFDVLGVDGGGYANDYVEMGDLLRNIVENFVEM